MSQFFTISQASLVLPQLVGPTTIAVKGCCNANSQFSLSIFLQEMGDNRTRLQRFQDYLGELLQQWNPWQQQQEPANVPEPPPAEDEPVAGPSGEQQKRQKYWTSSEESSSDDDILEYYDSDCQRVLPRMVVGRKIKSHGKARYFNIKRKCPPRGSAKHSRIQQYKKMRFDEVNQRGRGQPVEREDLDEQMEFYRAEEERLRKDEEENAKERHSSDDEPDAKNPQFRIERVGEWRYRKFNSTATEYVLKIRPPKTNKELTIEKVLPRFQKIMDRVLKLVTKGMYKSDYIKLLFSHRDLYKTISLAPKRVDQMSVGHIMDKISSIVNSQESFLMEDTVNLTVLHVAMPRAGHNRLFISRHRYPRRPAGSLDHSEYVKKSKSIVAITNDDHLCFGRALVVAKAHKDIDPNDRATSRLYQSLRDERPGYNNQKRATEKLFIEAGIDPDSIVEPLEHDRWESVCVALNSQWQSIKTYYQVFVWNGQAEDITDPMFKHPPPKDLPQHIKVKTLNLYYWNEHTDVITNLLPVTLKKNFCQTCYSLYNSKTHECNNPCKSCTEPGNKCWKNVTHLQTCDDCKRYFPNDACFEDHKKNKLCGLKVRCEDCKAVYKVSKKHPHVCDSRYCYTCHETVDSDHVCYITPAKYDYEHVIKNVKVIHPNKINEILAQDANETETWVEPPENDSRDEDLGNDSPQFSSDSDSDVEDNPEAERGEQAEEDDGVTRKKPMCLYLCFWDTESRLQKLDLEDESNLRPDPEQPPIVAHQHITNYLVSQIRCSYCERVDDPKDWAISESQDKHWRNRGQSQSEVNSIIYDSVHNVHRCKLGEHNMEYHYPGEDAIDKFYDDVSKLSQQPDRYRKSERDKPSKLVIAIAHNSRGYDSQFLLRHLYNKRIRINRVFQKGMKLISIEVTKHLRFEDSFNILPFPLASFPKSFGFDEDMSKQFFPYMLNTKENQWYNKPHLPELEYYEPEMMHPEKRKKFMAWYNEYKLTPFCLKTALGEYCSSDVTILRKGCMKFKEIIRKLTKKESTIPGRKIDGINPFLAANTAASLTLFIYRYMYMPIGSMVVLDTNYAKVTSHSQISQMWLAWMNEPERMDGKIQHARNGGEYELPNPNPPTLAADGTVRKRPPYKVDGFCEETKTVYEFHGCYYHACPKCYGLQIHTKDLYKNIPMLDGKKNIKRHFIGGRAETWQIRYENTKSREQEIRDMGYKLEVIWECDFKEQMKTNPELKAFVDRKEKQLKPPMNPRNCVQGGRVEAFAMYHQCENDDEEIRYVDVVSLYPHVMRSKPFPIREPSIVTDNFSKDPTEDYFGIIRCTVLPPRNLMYPVLGYHCRNKLMFPLCRKCAEESDQSKGDCTHDAKERCFTGVWCTPELKKAVEKGYEIVDVHEVWHFPEKSEELFTEHLDAFIKIKQESSGLPASVRNGEQTLEEYIQEFFQHENIRLSAEKIEKNEPMRAVSKIFLNSLWGKFCQRPCANKEIHVKDPQDFYRMIADQTISITEVIFNTDDTCIIKLKDEKEFVDEKSYINVVVAGFVTAYARLELFKHMETVQAEGCKILYCDTDSLVYVVEKDKPVLPIGSFIGDLTDEIEKYGKNAYIRTWIAVAPKFYTYEVVDRKTGEILATPLKAKGVPLTVETKKAMNYKTFETLVKSNYEWFKNLNPSEEDASGQINNVLKVATQDVTYTKFKIMKDRTIVSGKQLKKIKCIFDKRRFKVPDSDATNIDSVPWGFVSE
jgi:G:T-mismatch repair DNA endonuclease (very short patch repair protein)